MFRSSETLELKEEEEVETCWQCRRMNFSSAPEQDFDSENTRCCHSIVLPLDKQGWSVKTALIDSNPIIPRCFWAICASDINPVTPARCGCRPLRMGTWRKWRRRSDWKNANASGVRTKTRRAETTGASRPRRDADVPRLRNSPRTRPNSPSRWTPSSTRSSTTETGRESLPLQTPSRAHPHAGCHLGRSAPPCDTMMPVE